MFKMRTVKTRSGKTAVQVVFRHSHRTEIVQHIGSAGNDKRLLELKKLAGQIIRQKDPQIALFPKETENDRGSDLVLVGNLDAVKYRHLFAYEYLSRFYTLNGFDQLENQLVKDLAVIRVIEPSSKLRSLMLLKKYFGVIHSENVLYKTFGSLERLQSRAEGLAVDYAKKHLHFDFSLVFYDVTTLYFETFNEDISINDSNNPKRHGLRRFGFSKDNKPGQPQILIALVVNTDGYPVAVNIFEGSKFEGHTMIPVILDLKTKYRITNLTVVADAAMLSAKNMEELDKLGLQYIVGARLSYLSSDLLQQISTALNKQPGKYFRTKTPLGYLVCDYSDLRAAKDRSDRRKQLVRAQSQIDNPAKFFRRSRFVRETTASVYEINQKLIEKDELLDGIKGYCTNLKDTDNTIIVSRYKDLWKIEKAFRIAKSDLLARPIFHRKKENIKAHILIVFISLCMVKSIELQTGQSIRNVRDKIWEVLDIELKDKLTGKTYVKRTSVNN